MDAHVFIDNSNIFGGAQRTSELLEPEASRFAVRVYYKNLFKLVEEDFAIKTKMLAGSQPPGNDSLWDNARQYGYNTDLLHRIAKDNGKTGEQGVDELVHLKIANALLDFKAPQTLVLVTGDGKDADFGTSFSRQVERAIGQGWEVVIWSWKAGLSPKYNELAKAYVGKVRVEYLDPHYLSITSMIGGDFFNQKGAVKVAERRATSPKK